MGSSTDEPLAEEWTATVEMHDSATRTYVG